MFWPDRSHFQLIFLVRIEEVKAFFNVETKAASNIVLQLIVRNPQIIFPLRIWAAFTSCVEL